MSASNTDLPRTRAATVTAAEVEGAIPVPFSINTRMKATMCRATKKKIVGGSIARNSSLIFANTLFMTTSDGVFDSGQLDRRRMSAPALRNRLPHDRTQSPIRHRKLEALDRACASQS